LLPLANLDWMYFVDVSDFSQCLLPIEGLQCNLSLELRGMIPTLGSHCFVD